MIVFYVALAVCIILIADLIRTRNREALQTSPKPLHNYYVTLRGGDIEKIQAADVEIWDNCFNLYNDENVTLAFFHIDDVETVILEDLHDPRSTI